MENNGEKLVSLSDLFGENPELVKLDEAWIACYNALGGYGDEDFEKASAIIEARRRRIVQEKQLGK